jgi:hypothetical protein
MLSRLAWAISKRSNVALLDRKRRHPVRPYPLRDVPLRGLGQREPSDRVLDGDLPSARRRQEEGVGFVLEELQLRRVQLGSVGLEPEPDVCVEEEPQGTNSARTSSGRGSSKSAGTSKMPSSIPKTRLDEDGSRTKRATGRPSRVITTSPPSSTSRRSADRRVLASWTPTSVMVGRVTNDHGLVHPLVNLAPEAARAVVAPDDRAPVRAHHSAGICWVMQCTPPPP